MSKYKSINQLPFNNDFKELVPLLDLLEKVNPCGQEYEVSGDNIIVSYSLKLNLFNFKNMPPLNVKTQIIGLPVSVCLQGYFGNDTQCEEIIKNKKGLKIVLNGDTPFKGGGNTLSTFVFENTYMSFDDYVNALRSPYRRRVKKALKYRDKLVIRKFSNCDFNQDHYNLYLSIMKRTDNPLETLPIEFFKEYDAELYEFIDKDTNKVIGFVQLKEIRNKLYFLFGGFNREDIDVFDIYYNMLLKIVEIGIDRHVTEIEFGQTAEETKIKIGCKEKFKYLYIHHSNPILNFFIQLLVPFFSYKTYPIQHHVFKLKE